MNNDHLFRVSVKAIIKNDDGHLLVVKENNQKYWNLPGGGMDYGESIEQALARELYEEVGYQGALTAKLLFAEDAKVIREKPKQLWQMRLIYNVQTENAHFTIGSHATEIKFIDPTDLKSSPNESERKLYDYC